MKLFMYRLLRDYLIEAGVNYSDPEREIVAELLDTV